MRINGMMAAAAAVLFVCAAFAVPIHLAHEIHTWMDHDHPPGPAESDHAGGQGTGHGHEPHPVWEHAPEPAMAHGVQTFVLDLVQIGWASFDEPQPVLTVAGLSADTPEPVPRPPPASPRAPPVA